MLFPQIFGNREKIRFHTPGHGKLDESLLYCDVTELSYSDNLAAPQNEIKNLESFLASAYKAEAAFLSTQGATHSVMQAVYAVKNAGAILIVGKTHISVYNAARLFKVKTYHMDYLDFDAIPKDVKTVILTFPSYYGVTCPLEKIYAKTNALGLYLIVDSAHGAHFEFSRLLPVSASEYSDLAILSLHKTMPVVTGGSVLTAKDKFVSDCFYARNLLHTTSPNYMTMCSIESAVNDFSINGEKYYGDILAAVNEFKNALRAPYKTLVADDFSRLTVISPYDGKALEKAVFDRGFACEASEKNAVIFIVTPYNYFHLKLLARCINELPELKVYEEEDEPFEIHDRPVELYFADGFEILSVQDAVGKRVFNEIGLYPPGVPLIYSGEVMTKEKADILYKMKDRAFGLENGCVRVVK